jgi:hypothetical protein
MSAHGQLTSENARSITGELNDLGYDVYYDHGVAAEFVGKIVVTMYEKLTKKNEISQLDIAVIKRETNKAIALIEIEETTKNPKTLIGDLLAVLMGNTVYCPGKKKVDVGEWTSLIVIGRGSSHEEKNQHILEMANKVMSALGTSNCRIGKLVIETFMGKEDLREVLFKQIEAAIKRNK